METMNHGEADGLPAIEWSQVTTQLVELLTHDDPHSPNRPTFWLTTLNADGSPHVTSVGALWHAARAGSRLANARARQETSHATHAARSAPPPVDSTSRCQAKPGARPIR